jgi:DNA repair protein RecO (recombination protein O)
MPDQSTTILVLKKTKLAETDLIITGFSDEGHQVRAVVKGARRPGSKLGAHLELYSLTRVLLHKGRNLDVATEAFGLVSNESCRTDIIHSAAAAVIVELLDKVSADGDVEPRLFPLACEALRCVGAVPDEGVALIAAAAILKIAAQLGVRPSLRRCVLCGGAISEAPSGDDEGAKGAIAPRRAAVAFSADQGGVICENCRPEAALGSSATIDAQLVEWAATLITSRFVDLERYADAEHEELGTALLTFSRDWLRHHLVPRLKSLDFLLGATSLP